MTIWNIWERHVVGGSGVVNVKERNALLIQLNALDYQLVEIGTKMIDAYDNEHYFNLLKIFRNIQSARIEIEKTLLLYKPKSNRRQKTLKVFLRNRNKALF